MKSRFAFILLLALMLSVFSIGNAATVQIGSGSGSTGYLPLSGSYAYSYTQQIYTQEQINCAGTITKIRFYYVSGTIDNNKDLTIYLGHTQKDTFSSTGDWVAYSDLTQVFSGDVSSLMPASTYAWMEITLSTPFAYNNIDNLVLAVDENTPDSGNMSWGAFTSGSSTGIYYRDNTTNPDPSNPPYANGRTNIINRIQLEITATAAPLAPTLVSPADGAYAFDTHSLSWASTVGSAGVTGYDVYLDGNLVSSNQTETSYPLSPTMGLGQHTWYVVARNELGASPASETRTFELVEPVFIGNQSYLRQTPFNAYNSYGRSLALYTSAQIGQVGQISGLGWYVYTPGHASIPYKVYIKPTTAEEVAPMTWNAFTAEATLVKEGSYSFDRQGWHTLTLDTPFTFSGDNLLIGVEANFGGNGAGSGGYPSFYHSSCSAGLHQYWHSNSAPPTGDGTPITYLPNLAVIMAPVAAEPSFVLSPTEWNYGPTIITITSSRTFSVGNAGDGTLNITGISPISDGFFTLVDAPEFPVALTFGQTASFTINYTPTAVGNHSGTFTISHADSTADLTVSGECFDPTIHNYPYTEGFETGQAHDTPVQNWLQILDNGKTNYWMANSGYSDQNRSPRSGEFNAFLKWDSNAWLIKPFQMQADQSYDVEVWARQSVSTPAYAKLALYYGTEGSIAAMTNTIVAQTGIVSGDYQKLKGSFTPTTDGVYWIGIHGILTRTPYYLSIDDFSVQHTPVNPVFAYTPDAIGFGSIYANSATGYQDITVTNTAGGTLNLTAADISITGPGAAMFEIDPTGLPLALTADQSGVIPVRYNPTVTGKHNATLQMAFAGTNHEVALSGRAVGENALFESFEDTEFPPPEWHGNWSRNTSQAQHGSASAYKYGYYHSQSVLSTPMLIIEDDSTLDFWTCCANSAGILQVVYSSDRTNWIQIGANITFAESNTWYYHEIDLSALSGTNYYLGLRTGMVNYCAYYVDMVVGPEVAPLPPDAPVLISPANNASGVAANPTFAWDDAITGGRPASYKIFCDANNPPTTLIGTSTTCSFTSPINYPYDSTFYWTVTAANDLGESEPATPFSFTTRIDPIIYDLPWLEDFTATAFPPEDWARYTGLYPTETLTPYTSGWTRRNFDGNPAASLNIYSTPVRYWLVTPPISIPVGAYRLSFDLALTQRNNSNPVDPTLQQDDRFMVFIADNPTMVDATPLREWNNTGSPYVYNAISHTGTKQYLDLSSHSGVKYIAFYGESTVSGGGGSVYVDNVSVAQTPATPIFAYTPDAIDFGQVAYNTPSEAVNVTVTNTGSGVINLSASDISIIGTNAADFAFAASNLPASLAMGESVSIPVNVQSSTEGNISATLRLAYNAENYDVALSAFVLLEGMAVVGNGTSYNNYYTNPSVYGGYHRYGREQYILTAAELTAAGVQPGLINSIGFNVFAPNDCANLANFSISIRAISDTEFGNSSFFTGLTQVYAVDTYTPVSGWNQHVLTTPFTWNGSSNLVIQTSFGRSASYTQNASVYYTDTSPAQRTLFYRHDTTAWDTVGTGTLSYNRPNIAFLMDTESSVLIPPVVQASISGSNVVLEWEPVFGATSYLVYASDDPCNFGSDPITTVTTNSCTLPATAAMRFFRVVSSNELFVE
ncbi:MAG: choice-of-anchor D domain-containing protein [Candidatus Cloacimonadaceae bacterium]